MPSGAVASVRGLITHSREHAPRGAPEKCDPGSLEAADTPPTFSNHPVALRLQRRRVRWVISAMGPHRKGR
eukprot:6045967-Pyramimonas_sp.AAC.1